jgi:3-methylfumaryl-CoA hydratase
MAAAEGDLAVNFSVVDLFRYSAMTFNGHRIHYDAPYAKAVEGYAGLVVHGPLQATLLAHAAFARRKHIASFGFRGLSALVGPTSATMRITEEPQRLLCRMLDPWGTVTTEAWVSNR